MQPDDPRAQARWVLLGRGDTPSLATARPPRLDELHQAQMELGRPLPPQVWAVEITASQEWVVQLMETVRSLLVSLRLDG